MPPQSLLLTDINSTSVQMDLETWQDGGCPISEYQIQYKVWGMTTWTDNVGSTSPLLVSIWSAHRIEISY